MKGLEMEKLDIEELFFNLLAGTATLLTIYGFITATELKIFALPAGLISLGFYIRWYMKRFIIANVLAQNRKIDRVIDVTNSELKQVQQEISFIKGWIDAINHFKGKKGGAIDPVTLIVAIIIIIIIILYFQGKL